MKKPGAVWNAAEHAWELAARDADGRRQGECRWFREDGSLAEVRHYMTDVADGPFTAFHPDGGVARQGTFVAGQLHGALTAFASDAPAAEPLRACCVPETARQLRARYAHGRLLGETFHDGAGRPLLLDGSPWPERPPGVDAAAALDEAEQRWVSGQTDTDGNRVGTFRFWSMQGRLTEESTYAGGHVTETRVYGSDSDTGPESFEECGFVDDDIPHGRYRRRFVAGDSPYADARIREEHGTFDRGRRVGVWTFLDGNGRTVATFDLGVPLDEFRLDHSPAFARDAGASGWHVVDALLAQRRLREALCVAAGCAAADGEPGRLSALLARHRPPLQPAVATARGEELVESGQETLASALEALVTGVDGAAVFRCLAAVVDSAHPAALRFADAALLLAPSRTMTHLTRALIRIEQGDDRGALADAAALDPVAPEAARAVREHVRLTFPDFSDAAIFWPADETVADEAPASEDPGKPAQDLAAVHRAVAVYATRLAELRDLVCARLGADRREPTWLPPLLTALLPDGRVQLRVEDGIDERVGLDAQSIADLLATARADWSALSWLCWSVGLDQVALPTTLAPREPLRDAIAVAVARCFRAHDRVLTGGAQGRAQGLPSFTWNGVDIDDLPPHLARIPAAEYLAIRSALLWLVLADAESPFETELRDA